MLNVHGIHYVVRRDWGKPRKTSVRTCWDSNPQIKARLANCSATSLNSNYVGHVPTVNSMSAATSDTACGFACQSPRVASHRSFSDIIVVLFNTIFLKDMVNAGPANRHKSCQVCLPLQDILHTVHKIQCYDQSLLMDSHEVDTYLPPS
jgi:hypothetical protein